MGTSDASDLAILPSFAHMISQSGCKSNAEGISTCLKSGPDFDSSLGLGVYDYADDFILGRKCI